MAETGWNENMIDRVKIKKQNRTLPGPLFLALSLLLIFMWGCGSPGQYIRPDVDIRSIRKIAVLPLETLTTDEYAGEKIRGMVISELLTRGVDVIEPGEVTRVLRELKIRSLGGITIEDIRKIGERLNVKAVMMGSVGAFGISRGITTSYPEVSIHLMMLDTSTGNIIWSAWNTAGGPGFWTRHFGTEGLTLSETAGKVVKETIDALF
ncbi:hypothetical protein MNBD_NITROSPIRAE03-1459 [hydrothermal vent metagenome]|uniref:DUF4136 domain-containing protein n=1 Tax=hydrothermal vent metagenome TaxID=652676 RepID=A0A3B1CUU3_9ZZZZ